MTNKFIQGKFPCPYCVSEVTFIIDTRMHKRYRKCPKCLRKFTTFERASAWVTRKYIRKQNVTQHKSAKNESVKEVMERGNAN